MTSIENMTASQLQIDLSNLQARKAIIEKELASLKLIQKIFKQQLHLLTPQEPAMQYDLRRHDPEIIAARYKKIILQIKDPLAVTSGINAFLRDNPVPILYAFQSQLIDHHSAKTFALQQCQAQIEALQLKLEELTSNISMPA